LPKSNWKKQLEGLERLLEEARVIPHKLDGRVDFVGDSRCQAAHGFQLLGVAQLQFRRVPAGDVAGNGLHPDGLSVFVNQSGFRFDHPLAAILGGDFHHRGGVLFTGQQPVAPLLDSFPMLGGNQLPHGKLGSFLL
jgi:hypothetical protein